VIEASCVACRATGASEHDYFASLHIRPGPPLVLGLIESRGYCPAHTRALLAEVPGLAMKAFLYSYVIRSVVRSRGWRLAPARKACPACAVAQRACRSAITEACRSGEFELCLRHCRSAVMVGASAAEITTAAERRLVTNLHLAAEVVAGADVDASNRLALRQASVEEARRVGSRRGAQCDASCGICRRVSGVELDLLTRIVRGFVPGSPRLCDAHLLDIAAIDAEAGNEAALGLFDRRCRALTPATGGRSRTPAETQRKNCAVCGESSEVERWACRNTRREAASVESVCLAHVERMGRGARGRTVVAHLDARLEGAAWEVAELERKLTWDGRVETIGIERNICVRIPVLLDGRVSLGAPVNVLAPE
jgi:hypothetical protein